MNNFFIDYDLSTTIGIRILASLPPDYDKYHIQYEFIGKNWKESAKNVLPNILGQQGIRIQTAHPYILKDISNNPYIWVDNDTILYCEL